MMHYYHNTFVPIFMFSCVFVSISALNVLERTGAETKNVLTSSKTGHTIRQCSCPEEEMCIGQMKNEVRDCFHSCWGQAQLAQISRNPEQLKQCFLQRENLLDQFIDCIQSSGQTCVKTKSGPQIPYVDLNRLVGAGEQRLKAQGQAFMKTMGGENQKLIQTAVNVGTCMKNCFVQKNSRGSCFDHAGCSPKLEEDLAGPVIKKCSRQVQWKESAAQICDCALSAGVQSVKPYCSLLHGSARNPNSDNLS